MNYTEKYHLPQWEETDRIMRVDFNQMCADMEAGLSSNREAARQEAEEAGKLPYVIGTYTGTGKTMTFDIGFRPSFLIVSGPYISYPSSVESMAGYMLFTAGNTCREAVTFTDTGFILHKMDNENAYPRLVHTKQYDYIAFR